MLKLLYKSFILVAILGIVSCEPDVDQFDPNDDSVYHKTDIFGLVIDQNGQAISGALVTFDGKDRVTNEYGVYQYNQVDVNSRHSFINITKDGYFEATRTFRTQSNGGTLTQKTQLLDKVFDRSFDNESGGSVSKDNATLVFEPNTIVYDADQSAYNGSVNVAMHYLDPTLPLLDQQMPGDMTAVDIDSNYMALTTYGMVYVELQSNTGAKLQIKNGEKVSMTAEVPSEVLSEAPSSIKMWYFDDGIGLWKEEGSATLQGNTYVGEVGHFSCWNYDDNAPAITLSGRVIDSNGNPVGGVHVWVARAGSWGGGHGNTRPNGTFSGGVSKDEVLTLRIYDAQTCNNDVHLLETTIGPFSVDTDMGDIVVDLSPFNSVQVIGTILDCNDQPVTNGFVRIAFTEVLITDGTLDATVPVCDANSTFTLTAYDLNGFEQSSPITLTGPVADIGTIKACGIQIDYMEIFCTELNVADTTYVEIGTYGTQDSLKGIYGYSGSNTINIAYNDDTPGVYGVGSFSTTEGDVYTSQIPNSDLIVESGTVTITEYNSGDQYIKGSYEVLVLDPQTSMTYTFFGTFKLST